MNLYDPASLDRRDPELIARVLPLLETFNARYLRFSAHGAEHVPRGPVIFVGNHNGGIMGPRPGRQADVSLGGRAGLPRAGELGPARFRNRTGLELSA